jgi:hypothetical protein
MEEVNQDRSEWKEVTSGTVALEVRDHILDRLPSTATYPGRSMLNSRSCSTCCLSCLRRLECAGSAAASRSAPLNLCPLGSICLPVAEPLACTHEHTEFIDDWHPFNAEAVIQAVVSPMQGYVRSLDYLIEHKILRVTCCMGSLLNLRVYLVRRMGEPSTLSVKPNVRAETSQRLQGVLSLVFQDPETWAGQDSTEQRTGYLLSREWVCLFLLCFKAYS